HTRGAPRFRRARQGGVSVSGAGLPRPRSGAQPAGGVERGERNCGRAISRGAARLHAHRGRHRADDGRPRSRGSVDARACPRGRRLGARVFSGHRARGRIEQMTTLLAFAFVLGVLVFVHELGHFLAAKRVGIRVLKFQLGFNPTVVSVRRGDTEYGIGALPLGGYVKMAGESPEEVERDERGQIMKRSDEFLSKSKWERFQVLIMGPVMNILLALVLTAVVLYQGVEKGAFDDQPPVVGVVTAGSVAEQAGIRPGDRIIAVGGRDVGTWERFGYEVGIRPKRETEITFLRGGLEQKVKLTPAVVGQGRFEFGDIGVLPNAHPHVRSVQGGGAADKAGLKTDDVLVSVNDHPITFSYQLKETIAKHPEQEITLKLVRGGKPLTVQATPARNGKEGLLGIGIGDETVKTKPGVGQAITLSVEKNVEYAGLIFQTLWGLVTRETSPK